MSNMDLFLWFMFALLCAVGYLILRWFKPKKNKLGINGKLVWVDRGRKTKPFFNKQFRVFGKPDLMYRLAGTRDVLAVEFKSRKGRVYESDVVQAKTASLAARAGGFRVRRILVKTKGTEKYINLPDKDADLYAEIEQYVAYSRAAKQGATVIASPQPFKCRSCAYSDSCESAS